MIHYLEYKATCWFRIPIESEERLKEVINLLEDDVLPTELYDPYLEENNMSQCDLLQDTEEFIFPDENEGYPTIEIYSGEDYSHDVTSIWNNSYKSKIKRKNNKV
jgi:hypothetical protein